MDKTFKGLHYCPDNGWFGDPMPVWHDGEYHIYFNKPFRDSDKPQGDYRGGWGHIGTRDFITYTEYPDAFGYEDSERRKNIGCPTNSGCVMWGGGEWHAYYVGFHPGTDRLACRHAVSDDGISFRYVGEVFERLPDWYRIDMNFRDPAVFRSEDDGLWHMVFCARADNPFDGPNHYSGIVGHAVSRDLYKWDCLEPLEVRGVAGQMECPEVFFDPASGRWVLIYYYHETRIRTAASLEGPWERGKTLAPANFDFMAGRSMSDGERHILIGWISQREKRGFASPHCMQFPRELRLLEDGKTPAVRFVREIERAFSISCPAIKPSTAMPGGPGWHIKGNRIRVDRQEGGTMAGWKGLPTVCYIRAALTLYDENGAVEFLIGTSHAGWNGSLEKEWADAGTKVIVDMGEGMLRVRPLDQWDQIGDYAVLPYRFRAGQPIRIEILRDGDILEIGINEERTLSTTVESDAGRGFGISVQDSAALIENLAVWEMKTDGDLSLS